MTPKKLYPSCARCVRRIDQHCLAFNRPESMWRDGRCWGYTEDPDRVARELHQAMIYAFEHGDGLNEQKLYERYCQKWKLG